MQFIYIYAVSFQKLIEKYLKGRARGKGPKSIQSTDLEEEELRKLESR